MVCTKVTKMPIGLGMNHLEQEIAACQFWNHLIDEGKQPDDWRKISECLNGDLFRENIETGASLQNSGFIEVDHANNRVRLTDEAIEKLITFTEGEKE